MRLGIDRVVRACCKRLNRVTYEVAPGRDVWHIPEELVIYRWRRRPAPDGRTYHGFRLPPGTWRTVLACPASLDWMTASEQQVADALREVRKKHDRPPLRSPGAANLLVLVRYLSRRQKLADILARHRHVDPTSPGIPDVFLYWKNGDAVVQGGRFVEVKKPDGKVLESQSTEICRLKEAGHKAGVFRLIERW
jgi:hypothetical protein